MAKFVRVPQLWSHNQTLTVLSNDKYRNETIEEVGAHSRSIIKLEHEIKGNFDYVHAC